MYGPVPPFADTVKDPSGFPHVDGTVDVVAFSAEGSVIVVLTIDVHPLASVTV